MKIISIILISLFCDHLLFNKAARAKYAVIFMVLLWFFIVISLYFPGLADLPGLYIKNLER